MILTNETTNFAEFEEWNGFVQELSGKGDRSFALLGDKADTQLRQELNNQLLTSLVHGYIGMIHADPEYPEFIPSLGLAINIGAPVPDYMYKSTPIDGDGIYRISGNRGTSAFVDFTVNAGYWAAGTKANRLAGYTLSDLACTPEGDFEVILSNERPEGYTGDWWYLDPAGRRLGTRRACVDWLNEIDARFAIERLDRPARRPRRSPQEIARRMAALPQWVENASSTWLEHVRQQKVSAPLNDLKAHDYSHIGGALGQVYMEGLFDLAADEALVLDTGIPEVCRYWSILLADELFGTLDWMHRFSSINHHQADLSSDGRFRAVIAARDPGVPNWLDIGDYRSGLIQMRWNRASSTPAPVMTKVKLGDVWSLMPADTKRISPEERDTLLRLRRRGAQMRIVW